MSAMTMTLEERIAADRARNEERFAQWLASDLVAAEVARELIEADDSALNTVRHAFVMAYLRGLTDGASDTRQRILAAACPPITQVRS